MNKESIEQLLPLGSIVTLKGGTKKIMIIGRIQKAALDDTVYDYCACYYPEGFLSSDEMFLFQQTDIERIYFVGLQEQEEFAFRDMIQQKLSELQLL